MLYTAIDREYPAYEGSLPRNELIDVKHELFARSHRQNFIGRQAELKELYDYVLSDGEAVPVQVDGTLGIGKSALLAQLCDIKSSHPEVAVIQHYSG